MRLLPFGAFLLLVLITAPAVQAQNNVFISPNASKANSDGGSSLYIKRSGNNSRGAPVFTKGKNDPVLYNRSNDYQRKASATRNLSQEELHARVQESQKATMERIRIRNEQKQRETQKLIKESERKLAERKARLEAENAKQVAAERARQLAAIGKEDERNQEAQTNQTKSRLYRPAKKQVYKKEQQSYMPKPVFNPYRD